MFEAKVVEKIKTHF